MNKIIWKLRRLLEGLLSLVFPPRCPFCDKVVAIGDYRICTDCAKELPFVEDPFCLRCGKQLSKQEEYCEDCQKYRHIFQSGRSLFVYQGMLKPSVYRYKYSNRKEYARIYAAIADQKMGEYLRSLKADALIPVPLHFRRLSMRGFNQSALFAQELAKRIGVKSMPYLVRRQKNTVPQKELSWQERQNNLEKAFKLRQNDVKLKTIIIIDDIYTSGSTIDALSKIFLEAGVENIFFFTIASGE